LRQAKTSISNQIDRNSSPKRIKKYDFKQTNTFSNHNLKAIRKINIDFALLASSFLSSYLKTEVKIDFRSIDQLSYHDFIQSVSEQTNLALAELSSSKENFILEINSSVSSAIIDKLFGGDGKIVKLNRGSTKLELIVLEEIAQEFFKLISQVWSRLLNFKLFFSNFKSSPEVLKLFKADQSMFLAKFKITFGELESFFNFCFPSKIITTNLYELNLYKYDLASKKEKKIDPEFLKEILNKLKGIEIPLVAEIGQIDLKTRELLDLKVGDVIKLNEQKCLDNILIKIEGIPKYKAQAGISSKNLAFKVLENY